ncbi:type II toxin-antitoxin system VapC family toxin [Nocardioides sp. P5_C9_2]
MSRWYVDTSAALKLLVEESESTALVRALDDEAPDLVASLLLETELRRVVAREPALSQAAVSDLLASISLFELSPSVFTEAGLLPGPTLRSLDALHLAAAIRLGVDHVVTYDRRMAGAAQDLGLAVLAPA